jgi:chorismate mutase
MFIVVTVDTQIFPVGAIGGVISWVAILVMDGQKMPILDGLAACLNSRTISSTDFPVFFFLTFSLTFVH